MPVLLRSFGILFYDILITTAVHILVQLRLSHTRHPGLDPGTSCMLQRCHTRVIPSGSRIKSGMTGMREPRLDEDTVVIKGKYLKEVKPEHPMKNCV